MSKKSISEVWKSVSEKHRHIKRTVAVIKNENFIKDSISDLKIKINNPKVIDWGPGGGWLSKLLNPSHVTFVDIVDDYENNVAKNFDLPEENLVFHKLKSEDLDEINLSGDYDYGIMYSVIYHMPSVKYAIGAIKKMLSVGPKYVFIRNVFTDNNSWERSHYGDEYSELNYIRGNILNFEYFKEEVESSGYKIILSKKVQDFSKSVSIPDRNNHSYSMVIVLQKNNI